MTHSSACRSEDGRRANQLFTGFGQFAPLPIEIAWSPMRSREDRSKFLDRILNDSDEARYWAENCNWEPGTGYCRKRPCSSKCVFRDQRMREAERVINARRRRRPSQQTGAERPAPTSTALFVLRGLLRGVLA